MTVRADELLRIANTPVKVMTDRTIAPEWLETRKALSVEHILLHFRDRTVKFVHHLLQLVCISNTTQRVIVIVDKYCNPRIEADLLCVMPKWIRENSLRVV